MSSQLRRQQALALTAAAQSGAAYVHGDTRNARAFWKAAELLMLWPDGAIQRAEDGWQVPSEHNTRVTYTVRELGSVLHCSCASGRFGKPCKHAAMIETLLSNGSQG